MTQWALFPTPLHHQAAEAIVAFFCSRPGVDAVLLVNSCARGVATADSDLDLAVLVSPALCAEDRRTLEQQWQQVYASEPVFHHLRVAGRFTGVHLDLIDGQYAPATWDDGGGPDGFELELGNQVAYSQPLWKGTSAFRDLQAAWLPYYDDALQQQRLAMVRSACFYDLDHVPFYVARGLHFQAFDRLYKAFGEFLQALHIAHRAYPIAYNNWIHEQVATRLNLPDLYTQLPHILEIRHLESAEMVGNAHKLRMLVEHWTITEQPAQQNGAPHQHNEQRVRMSCSQHESPEGVGGRAT
jgi:predicted nucleotidyltransferase